ncbi:hypothetical protein PRUPE_7G001100 [Prunus persica]|uniref:Pentacotripeptide-repeat region of PRORP domain-containing protein n=1 Tax=Prunus persica TaxID=3760 RepID=A0A251N482_PRUPE|nr:pentatricopeptide repeat-containing protein At5g15010, mitochondrial [Prunus persica]XP_020424996.1 pentatricopeptide repeat-containing protein At5g15010, mitochondrial [Prunus persica]XP_020424997.1 pentatricopeptide repeat-containing protein At5g15010, mitochondrial [Prunus persica]XP_020424998.1 pentatricopeptide repeat-containing protein At5g15010, mitochondrial [Prunus persica]XP_020424999.1 pentatricopeptide repeat-containing protein At5g15010, mitochondrial [Prunus persica]XP_0204250
MMRNMARIKSLYTILLHKPTPSHASVFMSIAAAFALKQVPALSSAPTHSFTPVVFLWSSSTSSPHSKLQSSDDGSSTANSKFVSRHDDVDDDDQDLDDGDLRLSGSHRGDEGLAGDVKSIVNILSLRKSLGSEMTRKLDECCIAASSELVVEVLSRVRNDWESAFAFFLWAGKQPGYAHSLREYHCMISIMGKMRKFDTAWGLIDEMRGLSLVTPHTLLIMIRKYSCVHDVGKAINTFYAYKRFNLVAGMDDFHGLLSALCRYKNVQEAEQLLFCNRNVFPFNTKSFNIILNGWCNIIVSPREAERVWTEMSKRGVVHDAVSYSCLISCYSKASNINRVLKLFDRMKAMKIEADRKVYNALIYALGKRRLLKEAINLVKTMQDKGIAPNVVTYNSLIKPLCKAGKIDEARHILDDMLQRGHLPTIQTYHAFFRILRTGEKVFELLEMMKYTGCHPNTDTYIMLIRKFCRWRQLDHVFKLWSEMSENGVNPDRSSYIVLIHGLFLNGKLEEAYKYYMEMKEKQYLPEPSTEEMLQSWLSGKQISTFQTTDKEGVQLDCSQPDMKTSVISNKSHQEKDFLRQPETRKVVRERGFSFWEQ